MHPAFELHPQLKADTIEIGDLPLCKILLMNDSNYPWLIAVPRVPKVSEVYQLDLTDQTQLNAESTLLGALLMQWFSGQKLNVAALGNVVPQLHIHHIVRHKNDIAWPAPVWGHSPANPYSKVRALELSHELRNALIEYSNQAGISFAPFSESC